MSQLPPREPPDLRNRGQQGGGQYPPQNPQQPPYQGGQYVPPQQPPSGGYPPQGGQQYPPQQPPYPPQPGQQYPPLPGTGPLGQYQPNPLPPYQPPAPFNGAPLTPVAPPPLKNQSTFSEISSLFQERRIEYLAWGLVVLSVGLGIILLAVNTEAARNILLIPGPLFVGGILLLSGFLQRIVFGYGVSLLTWGVAVASTSFGLTQLIAVLTDTQGSENLSNQVLYFLGILVILSGMVIILQVFRHPREL